MTAISGQTTQQLNGWKQTTLGELGSAPDCLIQTGPFGSQLHKRDYQDQGVGVVNPTNISEDRIVHCGIPRVSSNTAKQLARHRLAAGDIVFGRRGEIGRHGLVTEAEDGWICGTGCFLVRIQREDVDNQFLSLFLTSEDTVDWLNRHAAGVVMPNLSNSVLHRVPISLPPLSEQREISGVLRLVQRGIEQQDRLIGLTTELKRALLQKLFNQGLRGEPQRQTEIGPVPKSWRVAKLGEYLTEAQYGISAKSSESGRYAVLRMTNQRQGHISSDNLQYVELTANQFHRFRVERQDILFNRTNSFELVGRTAIFDLEGDFVFASYLIRLRADGERLRPFFLNHYLNWEETQRRLKSIASRAVSQSNISATRLRGFSVPVPKSAEQDEIVAKLDCLDQKLSVHERKHVALTALFRTLLHRLMTAQIRVHNLDLFKIS